MDNMIEFTCCECERKIFTNYGGDIDERMCYKCLYKEEDDE